MRTLSFPNLCSRLEDDKHHWELPNEEGEAIISFDGLAQLGVKHFRNIFRAQRDYSIA
jgi:hypothetical protein